MIFTFLVYLLESPIVNVVYIPITISRNAVALCNLTGCLRHHDAIDAVPKLAEKLVKCYTVSI